MKLFMFYIGGDCGGSNIELHDVRFAAGTRAEDCYDDLRKQWWGDPKSLHLDCWGAIEQADGYDVTLESTPQNIEQKLFFLNMGGYEPSQFEELHKNVLMVGPSVHAVQARALKDIRTQWKTPHRDAVLEIEKSIDLGAALSDQGWYIHLKPAALEKPFEFTCRYLKLGA